MIAPATLATILLMASVTYASRIGGYMFLRNRVLSPRLRTMMESASGCVLITLIAPEFVSGKPADTLALGITILAARRLPILPTVLIAIASAGLLRTLIA